MPFRRGIVGGGDQKRGTSELRDQVNKFLADYKAQKGFEALGDKYLSEQKAAFKKMGIPFYF